MKKKWYLPVVACLALTVTGCVFYKYQPTEVFDLSPAVQELKVKKCCQVQEFRNDSGAGKQMLLKNADGSVETVHGSRWLSEPGLLVSRVLNRMLFSDAKTPQVLISGSVDAFVAEPEAQRFLLSGTFCKDGKVYGYRISVPLAGNDKTAIVKAANLAVAELAKRIAGTL